MNPTIKELDRMRRVRKVHYERTVNVLRGKDDLMCHTFLVHAALVKRKKQQLHKVLESH